MYYIFCTACYVLLLVILVIAKYRRRKFAVTCWFCSAAHKVLPSEENSWTCPKCEQYNGFLMNGDYNKTIPAFHEESMNDKQYCIKTTLKDADNGLCGSCTVNQQIIVKLIAEFEPFNEDMFDQEYKDYKKMLENHYPLCFNCQNHVSGILKVQSVSLMKNLKKASHAVKSVVLTGNSVHVGATRKIIIHLLELLSHFAALVLLLLNLCALELDSHAFSLIGLPEVIIIGTKNYLTYRPTLAVSGLIASVLATLVSGNSALSSADVLTSITWLAVQLIQPDSAEAFIDRTDVCLMRPILGFVTLPILFTNVVKRWKSLQSGHKVSSTGMRKLTSLDNVAKKNPEPIPVANPCVTDRSVPEIRLINEKDEEVFRMTTADHTRVEEVRSLIPISNKINALTLTRQSSTSSEQNSLRRVPSNHLATASSTKFEQSAQTNGQSKPLIKPARFVAADSVATTSWAAGGFWSKKTARASHDMSSAASQYEFASSGIITPPPSECNESMNGGDHIQQNVRNGLSNSMSGDEVVRSSSMLSSGHEKSPAERKCANCPGCHSKSTSKAVLFNLILTIGVALSLFVLFTGVILLTTNSIPSSLTHKCILPEEENADRAHFRV